VRVGIYDVDFDGPVEHLQDLMLRAEDLNRVNENPNGNWIRNEGRWQMNLNVLLDAVIGLHDLFVDLQGSIFVS